MYDDLMEYLLVHRDYGKAGPRAWPSVHVPVTEPTALWAALGELFPSIPKLGEKFTPLTRTDPETGEVFECDTYGQPYEYPPMENPNAFIEREDLGPFNDGSKLEKLEAVFMFEKHRQVRFVNENKWPHVIYIVWFFDFAETGYEGHVHQSMDVNPDKFAEVLWNHMEHDG